MVREAVLEFGTHNSASSPALQAVGVKEMRVNPAHTPARGPRFNFAPGPRKREQLNQA
jgi:hypothetical protein